jgi:hypothetical protein
LFFFLPRWFNQWPIIHGLIFPAKWIISASIAGLEYLPLTLAFSSATTYGVHLGLMTAFMEAMDNFLRMMQQLGLRDPLGWFDWVAALGLALCVVFQGVMHFREDRANKIAFAALASNDTEDAPDTDTALASIQDTDEADTEALTDRTARGTPAVSAAGEIAGRKPFLLGFDKERFIILAVGIVVIGLGSPIIAFTAGPTGQAYVLATIATAAKTFAWWINQYPQLKHLNFWQKWICGWSIAAIIEYFPLIGAMTIASNHAVHLGLMTAYMEALDNFFRVLQQRLLNKPLSRFDYVAAAGMFVCVVFQGVMRYTHDKN